MRTSHLKLKLESSSRNCRPHQELVISMPQTRPPIHYQPENGREIAGIDPGRRNLRSTRSTESCEFNNGQDDDSLDVESESDNEELPKYTTPNLCNSEVAPNYSSLRQRVANEAWQLQRGVYLPPLSAHYAGTKARPVQEPKKGVGMIQNLFVVVLVAILFAFMAFCFYKPSVGNNSDPEVDPQWLRDSLTTDMRIIRDKFPSQMKNIWLEILSGIQKVLLEKPTEPSIFLLIHQGTEPTSSCLARTVGQVAHNFLNASKPDPLIVDGATLSRDAAMAEDYGLLIQTYRPLVEEHRIMILDNLQLVPATLARGLHIFCDADTPLVNKAVYIFTLNIAHGNYVGNPTKIAERELHSLWNQLDDDIRSPLIVRITGGSVFSIQPEETMKNVC